MRRVCVTGVLGINQARGSWTRAHKQATKFAYLVSIFFYLYLPESENINLNT